MNNISYPEEVKEKIAVLDSYADDEREDEFDLLHIYPEEIAYPEGYYDSRFFTLVGFNTKRMTKRNLGKHDGLTFRGEPSVDIVRIFVDGSTLIRFESVVKVGMFQDATVRRANWQSW